MTVLHFSTATVAFLALNEMKKTGIKIIKRINAAASRTKVEAVVEKTVDESRLQLGKIVQNWISERRENSRLERIFTDNRIVAWKALPEPN